MALLLGSIPLGPRGPVRLGRSFVSSTSSNLARCKGMFLCFHVGGTHQKQDGEFQYFKTCGSYPQASLMASSCLEPSVVTDGLSPTPWMEDSYFHKT